MRVNPPRPTMARLVEFSFPQLGSSRPHTHLNQLGIATLDLDEPFITVIVATLLRSPLPRLLRSLEAQTLSTSKWELVMFGPDDSINEYEARNRASKRSRGQVLTFLDDDTYVPRDFLKKIAIRFEGPELKVLTCAIEGDIWGLGQWIRIDTPYLGIGTCLSVTRDAFEAVHGFVVDWDLGRRIGGWRSDSALLYSALESFGVQSYVHASDITVFHPEQMKSKWIPEIEREFYSRFRKWVIKCLAPNDPRLCRFLLEEGIERDPLVVERLRKCADPKREAEGSTRRGSLHFS